MTGMWLHASGGSDDGTVVPVAGARELATSGLTQSWFVTRAPWICAVIPSISQSSRAQREISLGDAGLPHIPEHQTVHVWRRSVAWHHAHVDETTSLAKLRMIDRGCCAS